MTSDICDKLGITKHQSDQLFFPQHYRGLPAGVRMGDLTQADAIVTLTTLIETGIVDWSHAKSTRNAK